MALKQPMSLKDLASHVLGTVIGEMALCVTKEMNSKTGSITNESNIDIEINIKKLAQFYDDTIPQCLHNVVTYHTLKYIADNKLEISQNYLTVSDLVLRCYVTEFSFCNWPVEMHHMFHTNLPKLKNLNFLYLDLEHMKIENLNYVLKGIENMKMLKTFKCKNISDDTVKILCDNCPLISLDFGHFNSLVSDVSVPYIVKLENLTILNILGTSISTDGQKQLLLGLPHLTTLWSSELNLVLAEIGEGNATSLQKVQYPCLNESDVTNLTKFCPSVRVLHIYNGLSLDLSNLASLRCLTSLFANCDFYKSNILTILERKGYQMTQLDIEANCISMDTLLTIDVSCPNLIRLSLNCISFSDGEIEFPTKAKVFQNLEYFSNKVFTPHNITPCLIFFLCNCIKIKEVEFLCAPDFCDDVFDKILNCNSLVNLQKLFLQMHKLTVVSVYKLLTTCKQLKLFGSIIANGLFGSITNLPTITQSEAEELHNYVQRSNLNVKLVNYSHFK